MSSSSKAQYRLMSKRLISCGSTVCVSEGIMVETRDESSNRTQELKLWTSSGCSILERAAWGDIEATRTATLCRSFNCWCGTGVPPPRSTFACLLSCPGRPAFAISADSTTPRCSRPRISDKQLCSSQRCTPNTSSVTQIAPKIGRSCRPRRHRHEDETTFPPMGAIRARQRAITHAGGRTDYVRRRPARRAPPAARAARTP